MANFNLRESLFTLKCNWLRLYSTPSSNIHLSAALARRRQWGKHYGIKCMKGGEWGGGVQAKEKLGTEEKLRPLVNSFFCMPTLLLQVPYCHLGRRQVDFQS